MPTQEEIITTAVHRCLQAWNQAVAAKKVKDVLEMNKWERAYTGQAYRNALPFLTTPDNVDAFIACVTHGIAIGAIEFQEGSKLLYAAQVAITSRRARLQEAKAQKEKQPTPTPHPPGPRNGGEAAVARTAGAEAAVAAPQVPTPPPPAAPKPPVSQTLAAPIRPRTPQDDLLEKLYPQLFTKKSEPASGIAS